MGANMFEIQFQNELDITGAGVEAITEIDIIPKVELREADYMYTLTGMLLLKGKYKPVTRATPSDLREAASQPWLARAGVTEEQKFDKAFPLRIMIPVDQVEVKDDINIYVDDIQYDIKNESLIAVKCKIQIEGISASEGTANDSVIPEQAATENAWGVGAQQFVAQAEQIDQDATDDTDESGIGQNNWEQNGWQQSGWEQNDWEQNADQIEQENDGDEFEEDDWRKDFTDVSRTFPWNSPYSFLENQERNFHPDVQDQASPLRDRVQWQQERQWQWGSEDQMTNDGFNQRAFDNQVSEEQKKAQEIAEEQARKREEEELAAKEAEEAKRRAEELAAKEAEEAKKRAEELAAKEAEEAKKRAEELAAKEAVEAKKRAEELASKEAEEARRAEELAAKKAEQAKQADQGQAEETSEEQTGDIQNVDEEQRTDQQQESGTDEGLRQQTENDSNAVGDIEEILEQPVKLKVNFSDTGTKSDAGMKIGSSDKAVYNEQQVNDAQKEADSDQPVAEGIRHWWQTWETTEKFTPMKYYMIQENDDINSVVEHYNISRLELLRANKKLEEGEWRPGMRIRIPTT